MMRPTLAVVGGALLLVVGCASTKQPPPSNPTATAVLSAPPVGTRAPDVNSEVARRGDQVYQYLLSYVMSLGFAKDGMERQEQFMGRPQPTTVQGLLDFYGEMMAEAKIANGKYQLAAAFLDDYEHSSQEMVSKSAQVARLAYASLIDTNNQMLALMEQILNGEVQAQGTLVQTITTLQGRRHQSWKMLPMVATPSVTWALMQMPEGSDERLSRIVITNAQRQDVQTRLEETLGWQVRQRGKGGDLSSVVASGALLYDFLEKPWKARDEE